VPLTPEQRKLCDANGDRIYSGPVYQARRARLIERAHHACERCGVPNHLGVWRNGGWWLDPLTGWARDDLGVQRCPASVFLCERFVKKIVLTLAHLTHDPQCNADHELAMLCQWCHFHHDKGQHKETRIAHKDAARPLLVAMEAAELDNFMVIPQNPAVRDAASDATGCEWRRVGPNSALEAA
jgi:hypothetical protein